MDNPRVHLQISTAQLRKLKKGEGFQASHKQMAEGMDGGHNVEIEIEHPSVKKIQSALRRGKGFRFSKMHIKGGSLRDIGNFLKEKGKQGIKFLGDNLGSALNYGKKLINQDALNGIVDTATSGLANINPYLAPIAIGANYLARRGIQKLYDTDYSHLNKKPSFGDRVNTSSTMPTQRNKAPVLPNTTTGGDSEAEELGSGFGRGRRGRKKASAVIANVLPSGTPDAIITTPSLKTIGKGKYAKGSAEAKSYMAHLRSLRKTKGGSFLELGGKKNGGSFMELGAR
jgi:hypothetical protein